MRLLQYIFSFVQILLPVTTISYKFMVIGGILYHSFVVRHTSILKSAKNRDKIFVNLIEKQQSVKTYQNG